MTVQFTELTFVSNTHRPIVMVVTRKFDSWRLFPLNCTNSPRENWWAGLKMGYDTDCVHFVQSQYSAHLNRSQKFDSRSVLSNINHHFYSSIVHISFVDCSHMFEMHPMQMSPMQMSFVRFIL